MQTAYLNRLNQTARDNSMDLFQAPYPRKDTINGDLTKLADNSAAVHVFINGTDILSAKDESIISLRPIDSLVQHGAIDRILDEVKPSKDDNDSGVKQDQALDHKLLRQSDENRLSTTDLKHIGPVTTDVPDRNQLCQSDGAQLLTIPGLEYINSQSQNVQPSTVTS